MRFIKIHRNIDTILLHHANVSQSTKLPMMYATKIPNDMNIDGNEPSTPRIFGSQHSLTCNFRVEI